MAHFAKISEENEVLQVLSMEDVHTADSEGVETESIGQQYLETHNNWPAHLWIQTSYNNKIRKQYASIGGSYDPEKDIFIEAQPFESWSLDDNGDWVPPTPQPEGQMTAWNELTQQWDIV